jgi:hypothetical protein
MGHNHLAMNKSHRYKLRLTAYTPDTIPMSRLAAYMAELANLLGSEENVHYKGATLGSTILQADVDAPATEAVEARVSKANLDTAPSDIQKHVKTINALLRADNARATLSRVGAGQVLRFLGCDAPVVDVVGPMKEYGELEGQLVRVGGKDRTVHALLVGDNDKEYKLTTSDRDLARRLATHLFQEVRVTGTGIWYRETDGIWRLETLHLESFEPTTERTLKDALNEMRLLEGSDWPTLPDTINKLKQIRGH